MELKIAALNKSDICEHLCNGQYYKDVPCTHSAKITLNGKRLCPIHLGIELYELHNVYREIVHYGGRRNKSVHSKKHY